MGWNCAFGVIRQTTVDEVVRSGVAAVGESEPADLILSSAGLALQQQGSSVVVIDGGFAFATGAADAISERCGRPLGYVLLSSVSETYGFYEVSTSPRAIVSQDGELVVNTGNPVDGEPEAWDEDATMAFFEHYSGVTIADIIDSGALPVTTD